MRHEVRFSTQLENVISRSTFNDKIRIMKTAVIFIGLFVVIAMVSASEQNQKIINAGIRKCINIEKPDQETIQKLNARDLTDKKVLKFAACLMKQLKVIKNNKIDVNVVVELLPLPKDDHEPATAALNRCKNGAEKLKDELSMVRFFIECAVKLFKRLE